MPTKPCAKRRQACQVTCTLPQAVDAARSRHDRDAEAERHEPGATGSDDGVVDV